MKTDNFVICVKIVYLVILTMVSITFVLNFGKEDRNCKSIEQEVTATAKPFESNLTAQYISMEVPNINSSFKTYMDYRTITNKNSPQYKFIQQWGWSDYEGFMRCNGEKDLGIEDNYYLIALGSYYGTTIGTKYRITTNTGRIFYGVLADCKAGIHTNSSNQYGKNNNIVEFLVDTRRLNKSIKYHGTANVYMPLNGSITKIERIDFIAK